jgi:hypothetical protein
VQGLKLRPVKELRDVHFFEDLSASMSA